MEQLASLLSFYSFHAVEYKSQPKLLDKQFCLSKFGPPNQPGNFYDTSVSVLQGRRIPFGHKINTIGLGD